MRRRNLHTYCFDACTQLPGYFIEHVPLCIDVHRIIMTPTCNIGNQVIVINIEYKSDSKTINTIFNSCGEQWLHVVTMSALNTSR